jgi:hypothetical protein
MIKRAPQMTEATKAEEDDVVKEIRGDLDRLLEWQADDAPKALIEESSREGMCPRREGSMMDTLYTRLYFADDEDDEVDVEDDDEITEGVHETKMQVSGNEQGIIDHLQGVSLEDKAAENHSEESKSEESKSEESKSEENTSEENNGSPLDQCSQTSRNSAALVHRTKEVRPGPTPSVSSDLATTQMLPAFLEDQYELQQSLQQLLDNIPTTQQGQQKLQQGVQRLLDNASKMQQSQDDLQHKLSAMQQGQNELQQHILTLQEGQQKLLCQHSVTQKKLNELHQYQIEMKAEIHQGQLNLIQEQLATKANVQRMQEQHDKNIKRLELKLVQQQREHNEQVLEGVEERANEKKDASDALRRQHEEAQRLHEEAHGQYEEGMVREERLRAHAEALKAKCQPSERELKLLEELEE